MAKSGKIYERAGDLIYEREFGSYTRTLTAESKRKESETMARVKEDKLWGEIRRAAKTNKTLQSALEQCIIIYKLSKEYKDGI